MLARTCETRRAPKPPKAELPTRANREFNSKEGAICRCCLLFVLVIAFVFGSWGSLHLCLVAGDQCSGHGGGEAEGKW